MLRSAPSRGEQRESQKTGSLDGQGAEPAHTAIVVEISEWQKGSPRRR